jgi:hypothetical protein
MSCQKSALLGRAVAAQTEHMALAARISDFSVKSEPKNSSHKLTRARETRGGSSPLVRAFGLAC